MLFVSKGPLLAEGTCASVFAPLVAGWLTGCTARCYAAFPQQKPSDAGGLHGLMPRSSALPIRTALRSPLAELHCCPVARQEAEELFETVSQCLQSGSDRDALSGWGAVVFVMCATAFRRLSPACLLCLAVYGWGAVMCALWFHPCFSIILTLSAYSWSLAGIPSSMCIP